MRDLSKHFELALEAGGLGTWRWTMTTGETVWDASKPDGQPRRAVDGSRARELLGWVPAMDFETGLRATIEWYLTNRAEAERAPH